MSRYQVVVGLVAIGIIGTVAFILYRSEPKDLGEPVIQGTNLYAGEPWSGKGNSGISQADAESFDDYGLFWLGETFEGFHLQGIGANRPEHPGVDEVSFTYGTCRIPTGLDGGCPVPLGVLVRPACAVTPAQARAAYPAPPEVFRGDGLILKRLLGDRGEDAMVWTETSLIIINSQLPAGALDRMLTALQSLPAAKVPAGAPLAPPRFVGCS